MNIRPSEIRIPNVRLPSLFLGIYFVLLSLDCFPISGVGSVLKLLAVFPIGLMVLDGGGKTLELRLTTVLPIVFVLLAFVSMVYSINSSVTLSATITILLNIALVVAMGACYQFSAYEKEWLLKCLIVGGWFTAALIMLTGNFEYGRLVFSIGGYQQDSNYINGYMLIAFSYHVNQITKKPILHLPLAFVLIAIVVLTGSRGAMLAFGGCAAVAMLFSAKESAHPLLSTTILMAMGVLAILIFFNYANTSDSEVLVRFSSDYLAEHGSTGRTDLWKFFLDKFKNEDLFTQFFGQGFGTSGLVNDSANVSLRGKVAHNLYIDNLTTIGILGCVLQIVMQVVYLKEMIRTRNAVLASAYVAYLIMCFSLSLTSYKPIWCIMMMFLITNSSPNQGHAAIPSHR